MDPGTVRLVAQRLNHYATLGLCFVMCGFVYVCGCFGIMFLYVYLLCFVLFVLCFLYCFVYAYLFLFVLFLLVWSDNSIAVSNNNNNKIIFFT